MELKNNISIGSIVINVIIILIAIIVLVILPIFYWTSNEDWKKELDKNTSLNLRENFFIYWAVFGVAFILIFFIRLFRKSLGKLISNIINFFGKLSQIDSSVWKKLGFLVLLIGVIIGIIYLSIWIKNNYSIVENSSNSNNRSISDVINCEFCSLNGGEGDEKFNANAPSKIESVHINQDNGSTEFTWSCMIKVNNWYLTNFNQYKMVMVKGSNPLSICKTKTNNQCKNKLNSSDKLKENILPDQCPGIWLDEKKNNILINFTTKVNNTKAIEGHRIYNVPIGKWFQITITSILNNVEIYLNGKLIKSIVLQGIPYQNNGNLYLGYGGGFSGEVSKIRYLNSALEAQQIDKLYNYDASYLK